MPALASRPILASLAGYRPAWLARDVAAGLAIAAVGLPSAIACLRSDRRPAAGDRPLRLDRAAGRLRRSRPSRQLIVGPDAATITVMAAVLAALPGLAAAELVLALVEGDLLSFNADHVEARLLAIADAAPAGTRWFVLDARAITQTDSTAAAVLGEFAATLAGRGVRLGFAEFNAEVRELLARAGLLAAVGPDMIFDDLDDALRAFETNQGGTS